MDASVELVKHLLPSVVHIHAVVARDHPSTQILGNDRLGSGVVEDAFAKGRRTRAEIVAQDFEVGLALLKVKRQGLPAAVLTDGDALEPGNAVIALASTGTQERRVGGGLVIYIGEFEAYWEYLLDRSIVASAPNPGFGGGGLFTLTGAMVGVLSLNLNEIARSSLAIPVDYYRKHEHEFLRYGRVVSRPRRAWLGVFAHPVEEGVVVAGVVPDGPGARGGLREGDLIVSINAEDVASRRDLYMRLWRHEPGDRLILEVMRDSKVRRVEVRGGDRAYFFRQL